MKLYEDVIKAELDSQGRSDIDPKSVLGFMRLKYGTLDHLSSDEFRQNVLTIIAYSDEYGKEAAKEFIFHA